MSARTEILGRITTALGDRPGREPREAFHHTARGVGDPALFAERVADYGATVYRGTTTGAILSAVSIERVVVPDGFPDDLLPGVEVVREPVDVHTLDHVGAVLTTCSVAIADTGTVVLDHGPGQGPRALTLVPDFHLVVVSTDQIVAAVPDALRRLEPSWPQTWVSGPSATSDIEFQRVLGVHGPRRLHVLIT